MTILYATFSRRFKIEKMNPAERRQMPISTPQMMVRSIPHIRPGTMIKKLPMAVATNHPPIIIPLYLGGATLLTNEIPIGDKSNSAIVNTK